MKNTRSVQKTAKKKSARGSKSSNRQQAPAATRSTLVSEGSTEFKARRQEAMEKVSRKYAWTAQLSSRDLSSVTIH